MENNELIEIRMRLTKSNAEYMNKLFQLFTAPIMGTDVNDFALVYMMAYPAALKADYLKNSEPLDFDEARMDDIGFKGATGEHYDMEKENE